MSTTYEPSAGYGSVRTGFEVRKELHARLQRHVVSKTENVLLWTHGLDARNEQTWHATAFEQWYRDHRPATPRDIHESQLAPLAIRGVASGESGCSVPWHFAWTRAFRTATQVSERVAVEIAIHEMMTTETDWAHRMALPLLGLAWACVETAVKGGDGMQRHMARFAVRLFDAFVKKSPVLALVFGELLKRCTWEEFEAWWTTGRGWSLSSPAYRGNREALNFAMSSIKFIGELYRVDMCPPDFQFRVLSLLCRGRCIAIEQLDGVGVLFSYLDARLRASDATKFANLKSAFNASCTRLGGSWTRGQSFDKDEVLHISNYVDRRVRSWEQPSSPLSQEAFPGQPVIKPNRHSIPSCPSYSSQWASAATSSFYPPLPPPPPLPPHYSPSLLLYSSSPASSYAFPDHPRPQ